MEGFNRKEKREMKKDLVILNLIFIFSSLILAKPKASRC